MQRVILPFKEIKAKINEGDVLLFRGQGWISQIIGSQTDTNYSHVAIASWSNGDANTDDGILECVEFRENYGGRAISLENEVKRLPNCIDVYRPVPVFGKLIFNPETKETEFTKKDFNGKAVTRTLRRMTGLPYGWKRILWMAKNKLVFFRLFDKSRLMDDRLKDVVYPVCSTTVSYSFNKENFDLINNKSDEWSEPGHIAMSARLNYLYTLGL
jgi:hypothetical protein